MRSVGENVEKLEPLWCTVGENGVVAMENSMAVPQKIKK